VGALARYGIDRLVPGRPGHFPWATLTINVTGSLAIGVALVVILERLSRWPLARPLIVTGVLGGYTTFSTFMVDAVNLARGGHGGTAVVYVVTSVVCGLGATAIGVVVARGVLARFMGTDPPAPFDPAPFDAAPFDLDPELDHPEGSEG